MVRPEPPRTSPTCTPGARCICRAPGWIGLDPTSGLLAGEGHIPLACTPEPSAAAPDHRGWSRNARSNSSTRMRIERVWEAPRVTKPYTEAQWAADRQHRARGRCRPRGAGCASDDGRRADLRFDRSIRTAPSGTPRHWARTNGALAGALFTGGCRPLCAAGPGALRPGQVVSGRAAAALVAELLLAPRRRAHLAAIPSCSPTSAATTARRRRTRRRACWRAVAAAPGRARGYAFAGLRGCLLLPVARAAPARRTSIRSIRGWRDAQERARLAARVRAGTGSASPATCCRSRATTPAARWRTGRWFLRGERCYLIPGDSPMGYRLPLDSLPWVEAASDYPHVHPPDPIAGVPAAGLRCGYPRTAARRTEPPAAQPTRPGTDPSRAPGAAAVRRTGSHAPRCAPSRARACCTSSCRPPTASRTTCELVAAVEERGRGARRSR